MRAIRGRRGFHYLYCAVVSSPLFSTHKNTQSANTNELILFTTRSSTRGPGLGGSRPWLNCQVQSRDLRCGTGSVRARYLLREYNFPIWGYIGDRVSKGIHVVSHQFFCYMDVVSRRFDALVFSGRVLRISVLICYGWRCVDISAGGCSRIKLGQHEFDVV